MDITTPGNGIFRVVEKGQPRLQAQQTVVEHDGIEITYTSAWRLGADDWRTLLAVAALAGLDGERFNGDDERQQQLTLWDHFLTEGVARRRDALNLRTTAYAILRESGHTDTGDNRKRLSKSLDRLAAMHQTMRRGEKVMSGARLLGYAHDEESGELAIGISPQMARAIIGESRQFVRISLHEVRRLGDCAALLHAFLSARMRPGATWHYPLDDLVSVAYGPEPCAPATLRKRRERVRKALMEFAHWTTWEVSWDERRGPGGRSEWTVRVHRVSKAELEAWEAQIAAERLTAAEG